MPAWQLHEAVERAHARHSDDWFLLREVGSGVSGSDGKSRSIDLLAFNLSRPGIRVAYEVKSSAPDLYHDRKEPLKQTLFRRFATMHFFVVPEGLVTSDGVVTPRADVFRGSGLIEVADTGLSRNPWVQAAAGPGREPLTSCGLGWRRQSKQLRRVGGRGLGIAFACARS
jgi:hypothetical protein